MELENGGGVVSTEFVVVRPRPGGSTSLLVLC